MRNEHRKNQTDIEMMDAKQQITILKDERRRLDADLTQCRKDLDEERAKSLNMTNQVERLKSLVENLDQTKDELSKRL